MKKIDLVFIEAIMFSFTSHKTLTGPCIRRTFTKTRPDQRMSIFGIQLPLKGVP